MAQDIIDFANRDGCRPNELGVEGQAAMRAVSRFYEFADEMEYESVHGPKSVRGAIEREIAKEVHEQFMAYLWCELAQYQATLSEEVD